MKCKFSTLLVCIFFIILTHQSFANSNHLVSADSSFTVFEGEVNEQTAQYDPFSNTFFSQYINLENTCGTPFILSIDIIELDIPEEWNIEYCAINTVGDAINCNVGLSQTYSEYDNFIGYDFYVQGANITATDTAKMVMRLFDSNKPDIVDTVTFLSIIEVGELPDPDTGFNISSNESSETYTIYSALDYVNIYNNIDIWNDNDSYVDLGWKVIEQFNPPAWEFDFYDFYIGNQNYQNQDIPTEGTFRLNPNEYQSIGMYTGIIDVNATPGTRSVEILIYDLNDSLNYNETLSFNANVELGDSGTGFEVFNTFSEATAQPFTINEPVFFGHQPVSIQNNDLFSELQLGWSIKNYDIPESWVYDAELLMMSSIEFDNYSEIDGNLSGVLNIAGGDYASIEYYLNLNEYDPIKDESTLEMVIYDINDSLATAQTITFLSKLEIPEIGTGFQVYENSTGSINYLEEGNNDPLFLFNSPLYVHNDSENIIEIGWKKLNETIPSEWQTQYEFNAYQDYFINEIPEEGTFTLNPYDQGYFALNFTEVYANNQAGSAELQILVYDLNDSTNHNEVLTFTNSICVFNDNANLIIPPTQTSLCEGDMITLETVDGLQNIYWSTGETTPSITIEATPYIFISAEDENGCPQNQELFLDIAYPYNESICVVSVDPISGNNVVIWDKTPDASTAFYNIYKETEVANEYILVGTQSYEEMSQFVDLVSDPNVGSNRYKISTINECGAESSLSPEHKTMHLTINVSNNDNINLIWDRYEGFDYPTFNILRGTNPSNMQLIAQRPSNTFTYTDIAPPSGDLFYQIEIVSTAACDPMAHALTGSKSNIVDNKTVSSNNIVQHHNIQVFPNPFNTDISIKDIPNDVTQVVLRDVVGRVLQKEAVLGKTHILQTSELSNGVYYLELIGEQRYLSKVVK